MRSTVRADRLDELMQIASVHGWRITDSRRTRAVMWFSRGREYVHVGVNVEGELFHIYGGVRGRPSRYWTGGRDPITGETPDRCELLARALRAEPFDTIDSTREELDR